MDEWGPVAFGELEVYVGGCGVEVAEDFLGGDFEGYEGIVEVPVGVVEIFAVPDDIFWGVEGGALEELFTDLD